MYKLDKKGISTADFIKCCQFLISNSVSFATYVIIVPITKIILINKMIQMMKCITYNSICNFL